MDLGQGPSRNAQHYMFMLRSLLKAPAAATFATAIYFISTYVYSSILHLNFFNLL